MHPKDTWYPDLYIDLLALFPDIEKGVVLGPKGLKLFHFYVCPGHTRTPRGAHLGPMQRSRELLLHLLVVRLYWTHLVDSPKNQ